MKTKTEEELSRAFSYLSAIKKQKYLEYYFPKNDFPRADETKTSYYDRYQEFIQRITLSAAADLAASSMEGDFLEIGAAEGLTTCCLAEIAKTHKRKLFVVDPYNGQECGSNWVYQKFLENTKDYQDVIVHLRADSRSATVKDILKDHNFSFCYVDGLHSEDAPANDINLSLSLLDKTGLLCVDDTEHFRSVAGQCFLQKCNNGEISPLLLDNDSFNAICDEKSWHFGIKI